MYVVLQSQTLTQKPGERIVLLAIKQLEPTQYWCSSCSTVPPCDICSPFYHMISQENRMWTELQLTFCYFNSKCSHVDKIYKQVVITLGNKWFTCKNSHWLKSQLKYTKAICAWVVLGLVLGLRLLDFGSGTETTWLWVWDRDHMALGLGPRPHDFGSGTETTWLWVWDWDHMALGLGPRLLGFGSALRLLALGRHWDYLALGRYWDYLALGRYWDYLALGRHWDYLPLGRHWDYLALGLGLRLRLLGFGSGTETIWLWVGTETTWLPHYIVAFHTRVSAS